MIFRKKKLINIDTLLERFLLSGEEDMLYQSLLAMSQQTKGRYTVVDFLKGKIIESSVERAEYHKIARIILDIKEKGLLREGILESSETYSTRKIIRLEYGTACFLYLFAESGENIEIQEKTLEYISAISYMHLYRRIEKKSASNTKKDLIQHVREEECTGKFLMYLKLDGLGRICKEKGIEKGELIYNNIYHNLESEFESVYEISSDIIACISEGPANPLRDKIALLSEDIQLDNEGVLPTICITQIVDNIAENSIYSLEIKIETAEKGQIIFLRSTSMKYQEEVDLYAKPFTKNEKSASKDNQDNMELEDIKECSSEADIIIEHEEDKEDIFDFENFRNTE